MFFDILLQRCDQLTKVLHKRRCYSENSFAHFSFIVQCIFIMISAKNMGEKLSCVSFTWMQSFTSFIHLQGSSIIDVSGPHTKHRPSETQPPVNQTVIRASNMRVKRVTRSVPQGPPVKLDNGLKVDNGLIPGKPLILYMRRDETEKGGRVLEVVPSLVALQRNEVCSVTSESHPRIFALNKNEGASSLHFTRHVSTRGVYSVTLTCHPIRLGGERLNKYIKIDTFTIMLELHLL